MAEEIVWIAYREDDEWIYGANFIGNRKVCDTMQLKYPRKTYAPINTDRNWIIDPGIAASIVQMLSDGIINKMNARKLLDYFIALHCIRYGKMDKHYIDAILVIHPDTKENDDRTEVS